MANFTEDGMKWVCSGVNNGSISFIQVPMEHNDNSSPGITTTNSGTIKWHIPLKQEKQYVPVRIIYNPPYTICYFPDESKVVVKCAEGEDYYEEVGVMACIMRKLFETRGEFVRLVSSGHHILSKEDRKK